MHFPQALAEHAGEVPQLAERVVVLFLLGHGVRQFIAQCPFQVVLRPFPGIALIAQIALGDHQQIVLTRGILTNHRAQQWRNITKTGASQIGAHFQFRVHARRHFADQFKHEAVADHHRAVRLFGGEVTHFRLSIQAKFSSSVVGSKRISPPSEGSTTLLCMPCNTVRIKFSRLKASVIKPT
jgi:hypothetical protein